MKSNNM